MTDAPIRFDPLLGLHHLLRLRRDPLRFYAELQAKRGDVVRLQLGPSTCFGCSFFRTRSRPFWPPKGFVLRAVRTPDAHPAAIIAAQAEAFSTGLADRGETVHLDVDAAMGKFMLDVALTTIFSATPSRAARDEIGDATRTLSDVADSEATSPIVLPGGVPTARNRRKQFAIQTFDTFVRDLVAAPIESGPPGGSPDLLATLVDGRQDNPEAIRDDVAGLLIAGHETSAAALSWAFPLLAPRPDLAARVRVAIDTVCGDAPPGPSYLPKLTLLDAVIPEILRLDPTTYTMCPRGAVEDVVIAGQPIHAADNLQLVPYGTQSDARRFPDHFAMDPDRWGGVRGGALQRLPFRRRPARLHRAKLRMLELTIALATLIRRKTPPPKGLPPTPKRVSHSARKAACRSIGRNSGGDAAIRHARWGRARTS